MQNKLSHQQRFMQKMALTPQMRQSINMLSMSASDLAEYIELAVTQNPFLKKILDNMPVNKSKSRAGSSADTTSYNNEQNINKEENPRFSLLSQLKMMDMSDKELEIAEYLIFEMDDNGYIKIDHDEVAQNLGVSVEEVLDCIKTIQGMEPAGIGAEDITECLQLQLKRMGKENSLEYKIVSSLLTEVAREDFDKITKALKTDRGKVKDALANIKKLNPRPASTILSKEADKVIPELIAKIEKNKVRLELNRGAIPDLKLYNPYANDLNIIKDPEARKFLKENMSVAKELIDNLKRREDTMCKVTNYILGFQRDTITHNKNEIKKLTINDVAKAVNFHPSTISRTVSNKYIQINDKVMELNSFLSHGIKKEDGEITSKTAVKGKIKELIRCEDKSRPVSDIEICDRLKGEGIKLARRTVAKYRKALQILPAHLRKKIKSAG